jgi:phenylalanyl-tRNA synthetase beta chain
MPGMPDALRRAIELIIAVAGGTLREPPLDLWPVPTEERTIFLRPERVGHVLGMTVERPEIERILSSIGFFVAPKDARLAVQVPGWRPDVTREVDLIEEVARLKGYDAFPDELRPYRPGTVPDAPLEVAKGHVRAALAQAGLYEARTFPLGPADGPEAIAVLNPMSAEEGHLRTRLLPGLVRRVEHNWAANAHVRCLKSERCSDRGRASPRSGSPWRGCSPARDVRRTGPRVRKYLIWTYGTSNTTLS